jgi:putative hemolysin
MAVTPGFLIVVGACLALSFLLSGMEAGVLALSRVRIRHRARQGERAALLLQGYLDHLENFLWTILVGNTVVNFLIVTMLVLWLHTWLGAGRLAFVAGLLLLALLLYTFLELLPKLLFRAHPNRLTLWAAVPFRFVHLALAPLVGLIQWLSDHLQRWTGGRGVRRQVFGSREELRFMLEGSGSPLTTDERTMISRVLDLQRRTAGAVARPMDRVVSVNDDTPAAEIVRLCREHGVGRVPVWRTEDGRRRIIGIVPLNAVLFSPEGGAGRLARDFLQAAVFVDADTPLDQVLERLRRAGRRVAIVMGPDGREAGLIGLRDILRHIFGEDVE